jgi:hypothetical protein
MQIRCGVDYTIATPEQGQELENLLWIEDLPK